MRNIGVTSRTGVTLIGGIVVDGEARLAAGVEYPQGVPVGRRIA